MVSRKARRVSLVVFIGSPSGGLSNGGTASFCSFIPPVVHAQGGNDFTLPGAVDGGPWLGSGRNVIVSRVCESLTCVTGSVSLGCPRVERVIAQRLGQGGHPCRAFVSGPGPPHWLSPSPSRSRPSAPVVP